MQVVVPAAGEGTRMGPLTDNRPKGLVEVAGRPLLTHCFEAALDLDPRELVVVVRERDGPIQARYGPSFRDVPVTYVTQPRPTGLARAVLRAAPVLRGPFAVWNGDNVLRGELAPAVDRFREPGVDAVLPVEEVSRERARTTAVCVLDGDGRLTGLVEKPADPPSRLALTGLTFLPPAALWACRLVRPSEHGEHELSEAVDLLVRAGYQVETVELRGWRRNVNTLEDVAAVERRLAGE